MRSRPLRACLSVLLVFTLLSMLTPHAAMALPMLTQGAGQQMHMLHGVEQMADHASSDRVASHDDQHGQCNCGVHCALCGACHSGLPAATVTSFMGAPVMPAMPRLANLAEITLSPDPRPPRV